MLERSIEVSTREDFLYSNGKKFYSKIFNGLRTPPSSLNFGIKIFTVGIQEILCYESTDGPKFVLLEIELDLHKMLQS